MLRAQLEGSVPHVPAPDAHLTGFTALYAEPGRVLRTPEVPDEPWITEAQILVQEGDLLAPPARYSDAAAIVSVRGDTEAQVMSRLAALAERISIPTAAEPL
ncbi:hypothetical protein [Streptomyces sp. Ac-502]|uniref:hypothetical protein n=1 Tax=Streptomyces sp. Ac-502 TaxID=3342801 RepID=UPI00386251AA